MAGLSRRFGGYLREARSTGEADADRTDAFDIGYLGNGLTRSPRAREIPGSNPGYPTISAYVELTMRRSLKKQ